MIGGLLKSVTGAFKAAAEAPQFQIPATLPKLEARSAAELFAKASLEPTPGAPNLASQSPAQFLAHKFNTEQDMLGGTKALAHGLPQKDAIKWATDSAQLVAPKLPPAQKDALAAAQAFNQSPTAANRSAAGLAADKAGLQGPGALAAKAASLADVPGAPAIPGGSKLLPTCVTGAVVTAAALSAPTAPAAPAAPAIPSVPVIPKAMAVATAIEAPKAPRLPPPTIPGSPEAIKNAQTFKPFIEKGLAHAAGTA